MTNLYNNIERETHTHTNITHMCFLKGARAQYRHLYLYRCNLVQIFPACLLVKCIIKPNTATSMQKLHVFTGIFHEDVRPDSLK